VLVEVAVGELVGSCSSSAGVLVLLLVLVLVLDDAVGDVASDSLAVLDPVSLPVGSGVAVGLEVTVTSSTGCAAGLVSDSTMELMTSEGRGPFPSIITWTAVLVT